jgi:hypothetical protein
MLVNGENLSNETKNMRPINTRHEITTTTNCTIAFSFVFKFPS